MAAYGAESVVRYACRPVFSLPLFPMTQPFPTVALTAENIACCADLYLDVFNAPPWNDGWERAAVVERLAAFMAFPAARGMALLVEEAPVAMVLGWKERWVNGWTFHIKEMCVAGHMQRQGAGSALMRALEDVLRRDEVVSMNLQTLEEAPAFGFYEGLGYRKGRVVMLGKRL